MLCPYAKAGLRHISGRSALMGFRLAGGDQGSSVTPRYGASALGGFRYPSSHANAASCISRLKQ